jgi:hypothetical protein
MDDVKNQQANEKESNRKGFFGKLLTKARIRGAALTMMLVSLLTMSCFAEGSEVTVSGVLSEATPVLTTATSSVWSLMTSNPVCKFALGCAVLAVGFRFLRKAIRISHKA